MKIRQVALCLTIFALSVLAQDSTAPKKALDRIIGAVTAVDKAGHKVTVKEDKTSTEYTVDLSNARTLIKVQPGAKDLTGATRITADDLQAGDRVQIGGSKSEGNSNEIAARSVILMSGRELQQAHAAEAAAWQHSTPGTVTSVDTASGKINANIRSAEGTQPVVVDASKAEFTRYSPENPKNPVRSQLRDIQPADHILLIGEKNVDGTTIIATKIYSGAFRTINGSVVSISPDGKQITVRNLATKQPVQIALDEQSAVRRLPPMLAMGLARRLNPDYKPVQAGGAAARNGDQPTGGSQQPGAGEKAGANGSDSARAAASSGDASAQSGNPGRWQNGAGGPGGARRAGNGDISQLIERLPKANVTDLKPGDAVVISGVATGNDNSRLLATNVIAGVEPILQSAPRRQSGEALGGDWGLGEIAVPQ